MVGLGGREVLGAELVEVLAAVPEAPLFPLSEEVVSGVQEARPKTNGRPMSIANLLSFIFSFLKPQPYIRIGYLTRLIFKTLVSLYTRE